MAIDPLLVGTALVKDVVGQGGFNLLRICESLHLKPAEFAVLTHRTTESVARSVKQDAFIEPEHPATVAVLRQLVQILGLLRSMEVDAATWLKTPLPSYEGQTPFELVEDGKGQELIGRLLGLAVGDVGG
jgi:hypothetical protein